MSALYQERLVVRLALVLCATAASPVDADPPPTGGSSAELFEAARALAKAGHYAEACPQFERSLALEHATGTEVNLADCYEHIGQLQRALDSFETVVNESLRDGNFARAKLARQRADALAGRMPPKPAAPAAQPAAVVATAPDSGPGEPQTHGSPSAAVVPLPGPPVDSAHATFRSMSAVLWDVVVADKLACTTPCDSLLPARQLVVLVSHQNDAARLEVGPLPSSDVVVTARPRNDMQYYVGVAMIGVTGAGTLAGLALTAVGFGVGDRAIATAGVITDIACGASLYASIA